MNRWRVVALLAILFFIAALSYALHLFFNQRDPLDVLKEGLADPAYAAEFIQEGDPSFYPKLGAIGDMARKGDADALVALITVSGLVRTGRDMDFLSYCLTEVALSQPELFLAVCSRMGDGAEKTVEMVGMGLAHYGTAEAALAASRSIRQAARNIRDTSEKITVEIKKARRIESRKEAEKDPVGSN